MFDHNHDGKLSASERMERDYFINEVMNKSDNTPTVHRSSGSDNPRQKLLGMLFLFIGLGAFVYFPVFALIMIGLAIFMFVS